MVVMGIPMRVAVPWEWTAGWAADGERDCAEVRLRGQTPVACVEGKQLVVMGHPGARGKVGWGMYARCD